jgi:hypothetical protein
MAGGQRWCGAQKTTAVLAIGLMSLVLAACGASSTPEAPQPSPAAETALPTPAPSPTSESPSIVEEPSPTEGESEPSDDDTPKPPVLTKDVSGRDLTTTDFFKRPDGWQDGRFSAAGKQDVPGVSGTVDDCADQADDNTPAVELRLANNFTKISMIVAQGDDSEQSDAILNVRAEGNGTYKDTAHVPFNTTKAFSVQVAAVNAFKLQFWLSGKKCSSGEDVRVVLTNLRVE